MWWGLCLLYLVFCSFLKVVGCCVGVLGASEGGGGGGGV